MSSLWPKGVKRTSSALRVGPYGQPILTSGYFEINGVRLYDDDVVVDRYGQPVIREGKMEIHQDRTALKEANDERA